jgi:LPS sulfotransferase NodH
MLKKILRSASSQKDRSNTIFVVSGLPRSGTSMMMNMLVEGGVPGVSDSIRNADEDNPNGYFEFGPVKQLSKGQNEWLAEADHKVVKIVSALLEYLPAGHHYKILFMERDFKEILASQLKMLNRRKQESKISDTEMEIEFHKHLKDVKYWLARQPNIEVLYINYNQLMANPDDTCPRIADFIGIPVDQTKMRSVPNEHLYRNRAARER